jgi:hypothetical protein
MDFLTLVNSILTTSSILVAVGFPFLIFIVTDYKNKKEKLLAEIRTFYPKLNSFRKLIYHVYNTGIVKDYSREMFCGRNHKEKEEIEKSDVFLLFKAFKYISEKYSEDLANTNTSRIFTFKEVKKYQTYANRIWYDIDCRTDIKQELNHHRLEDLEPYKNDEIRAVITNIGAKYLNTKLTIGVIASIAGDFEIETANELVEKTFRYEKPIPKVVKLLFFVLTISVLFGVLFPLLLLQFPTLQLYSFVIVMIFTIILCFISIVLITGKYIWSK